MKARVNTIRMAISRTRKEIRDPVGTTGIKPIDGDPERRWSVDDMKAEAQARLDVLEALL